LLKTLAEQRQVEQPFAGIIDNIERQGAVRADSRASSTIS
jgi:hypothetical protein